MKSYQMRYACVLLTPAVALQLLQLLMLLLAPPLWARPNLLENATATGGDPELHHHHHHHHLQQQQSEQRQQHQQQQQQQQPAESRGQQAEQLLGPDGSDSELVAQRIVNHHPDHHHQQQQQEQQRQQEQQQLSAQMAPLAVNRYSDNPLLNSDDQPLIPDKFTAPAEPLTPIEHHHHQQQQQISPEDLNTHPLGGPAGPLGAVVEQCPGPEWALPCVSRSDCDPFTGFVERDGVTLAAPITKDTPTVALLRCQLAGAATVGVCCKRLPTKVTPPPTGGPVIPTSTAAGWHIPAALSHTAGNRHEPSNQPANPFLPEYTQFKRQQQQNGAHVNPFLTNNNQLPGQQNQEQDNIEHDRRDENSINNTPLSEYNQQQCPCQQQQQQQYKSGRIQPRNAV